MEGKYKFQLDWNVFQSSFERGILRTPVSSVSSWSNILCYIGIKWPSFSVDFVDGKQNQMVCFGGSVLVSQLESTWSLCLCCASWPSAGVRIQRLSAIVNTIQGIESLWYRTALECNTLIINLLTPVNVTLGAVWWQYSLILLKLE